jgi:hypothetical protein
MIDGLEIFGGIKRYWKNNMLHRDDGPAIEFLDGRRKCWYKNGKYHREDGPAVWEASGYCAWYIEDNLHRLDGPALIYEDGFKEWYVNDGLINVSSQKEFEQYLKLLAFM